MRTRTPGTILLLILCILLAAVSCRRQTVDEETDTLSWGAEEEKTEPEKPAPEPEQPVSAEEPVVIREEPETKPPEDAGPEAAPAEVPAPAPEEEPAGPEEISLRFLTPAEGSFYGPVVHVEGTLDGAAESASWEVLGTGLGGPLEPASGGRFRFSFPTADLSGDLLLRLRASSVDGSRAEVSLTLRDNPQGPYVGITRPAAGSAYQSEVLVSGEVWNNPEVPGRTDGIKTLTYSITGTDRSGEVSYGSAGGYSFYLNTAGLSGTLVLEMKAEDYRGRTSSGTVTLVNDGSGPWLEISEPADGSLYTSTMTVRGRAADSREALGKTGEVGRVSWTLAGTDAGGDIPLREDGGFSFPLDTTSLPGQSVLTVRAEDLNGNTTDRKILLKDDGEGPFITLQSPADGAEYGDTINLRGRVVNRRDSSSPEGEVASLRWAVLEADDLGADLTFTNNGSFSTSIPADALRGTVTVEVAAVDRHGNRSAEILQLRAPEKPAAGPAETGLPEILPAADRAAYRSALTLEGRVTGPGASEIRQISWNIRGTGREGTVPVREGSFSIKADTAGLEGSQIMSLRAEAGSQTIQRTVMLTESSLRPHLAVTSPADGDVYRSSVVLAGTVSDRQDTQSLSELKSLTWQITGTDLAGEITPDQKGGFSLPISTEGMTGDLFLRLAAEDSIGKVTERTLTLRDDGTGPRIEIASPQSGDMYGVTVTCRGRISDGPEAGIREVKSAGWAVRGTALRGSIDPGREGDFSFSFSGIGLPDPAVIEVRASDRNTHESIETITLRKNTEGMVLDIREPGDLGFYRDSVRVSGRVRDGGAAGPSIEGLKSLSWHTSGNESAAGSVYVEQNGDFNFSLNTGKIKGSLQVVVEAEDRLGNMTRRNIRLLDGKIPPAMELESPEEGSLYGAGISIEGRVLDPYSGYPDYGGIDRIDYEMTSARYSREAEILQGTFRPDAGGRFSYPLNTLDLRDDQQLTLRVYADNGNVMEKKVLLKKGGSGIPSFRVVPGDRSVRVSWYNLPFAESYSLRYVRGGPDDLDAGAQAARNVTPPLTLSRLENGARYSLVLDGVIQGMDVSSEVIEVIPLAGGTLKPRAEGGFQQITLNWDPIPGADRFSVHRAEGLPENFILLETVEGSEFLDTAVQYGITYFYRIAPADGESPAGDYTEAVTLAAPAAKVTAVASAGGFSPLGMTVYGDYAFVPAGSGGLKIFDISDPARGFEKGSCETADARDVVIRDDFAYLADGIRGLKVISIVDPQNPLVVGSRSSREAMGIDVSGNYAYLADGPGGFRVFDIRNEGSPERISTLNYGDARSCVVKNRYAYLAAGPQGLRIVDISSPANPVEAGVYFSRDARDLAFSGEHLYVADAEEGLIILDVSNPEKPGEVGRVPLRGSAALAVKGQYAFVAAGSRGMVVIDTLDPTAPSIFDETPSAGALDLGVKDNFVLMADESGLRIIRIYLFGTSFAVSGIHLPGTPAGITVEGSRAYVSARAGGVHILDISRPGDIGFDSLIRTLPAENAKASVLWKGRLLAADGAGGVKIFTEPYDEDPLALDLPGDVADLSLSEHLLYTALGRGGLGVTDLSPLEAGSTPEHLETLPLPDVRAVCAAGGLLLAADRAEGLVVFSTAGGKLERVGSFPLKGIKDIALSGTTAAAAGSDGLTFIDLSDPDRPERIGLYPTRFAEAVHTSGGYYFLSEGYKGLSVLSLSRQGKPMRVSTCPVIYAVDSRVSGGYAFTADGEGMSVVRIIVPDWLARD